MFIFSFYQNLCVGSRNSDFWYTLAEGKTGGIENGMEN
jgi:hypothetical protein